jgi:hypothetical protein
MRNTKQAASAPRDTAAPDLFAFTWGRASEGYELAKAAGPKATAVLTGQGGQGAPLVLRRKGAAVEWYEPAKLCPNLHRDFAKMPRTPEAARDFANQYGLLGLGLSTAEASEESVDWILEARDKLRTVLLVLDHNYPYSGVLPGNGFAGTLPGRRKRVKAAKGRTVNVGTKLRELEPYLTHDRKLNLAPLFNDAASPQCTVRLDITDPKRPALRVVPRTLYSWMWLRVAQEISGGGEYRQCKLSSCNEWFFVTTDKRRARQDFCCDAHRVRSWRDQQRKERKP